MTRVLDKFDAMRRMMIALGDQPSLLAKLPGFGEVAQVRKLRGLDLGEIFGDAFAQELQEPDEPEPPPEPDRPKREYFAHLAKPTGAGRGGRGKQQKKKKKMAQKSRKRNRR